MDKKYWFFGLALLVSFASGRWLAPEKVKTVVQTVEIENKSNNKDSEAERNKKKETTTTEKTNLDGSTEKTTHTVEETDTTKKTNESDSSQSTTSKTASKEIERGTSKVTISALAGTNITAPQIVYGASVYRGVLGPIGIGLFGFTNGIVGAMIGLSF